MARYSEYGSGYPYSEFGGEIPATRFNPYSYSYPSYIQNVPVKAGDIARTASRPFFGRSCCLITFLSVISLAILGAAIALGVVAVQNNNNTCPSFTCPDGYVFDSTGTACESVSTDLPVTCPTVECPTTQSSMECATCASCSTDSAPDVTCPTVECPTTQSSTDCAACPSCPSGSTTDVTCPTVECPTTQSPATECATCPSCTTDSATDVTCPTVECPTTQSPATECATCPSCPSEATTQSSAECPTCPSCPTAPTEQTTTETQTTTVGVVAAPQNGFMVPMGGQEGPTFIPTDWAAYPGNSVEGGDLQLGSFNGDQCVAVCNADSTCEACDFNSGFSQCYFHYASTKCDPLLTDVTVYHMKKLPLCSDPAYPEPAATNPPS